jgi:signal transduction histidine kinase
MDFHAPLSWRSFRNPLKRYALALVATALALLVARGLESVVGDLAPYVTVFPAVAFSAWYCGLGPSVTTIALALLGVKYWFVQPIHSLRILAGPQAASLGAFLLAGVVIVVVGEASYREKERLLAAQGELEDKVTQRTAELDRANQSLSELTARLLRSQDDERRRIARDLHDSIGQTLAALGMNLSTVEADIGRLMKTVSVVKDSKEIVRETTTNIRTISYLLHPPLLDEKGLASALPWYIDGFAERSKIRVDLQLPEDLRRLSRDSEIAIFRVVQECLTNIHRHSGSTTAKIRVSCSEKEVCVVVEDRGKGIPFEKLCELAAGGTPGVGIRGMRERIRQLGGSMQIESQGSGKGAAVITRLPLVASETPIEATN